MEINSSTEKPGTKYFILTKILVQLKTKAFSTNSLQLVNFYKNKYRQLKIYVRMYTNNLQTTSGMIQMYNTLVKIILAQAMGVNNEKKCRTQLQIHSK